MKNRELYEFAYKLNQSLPASEQWFWDKWRALKMIDKYDYANKPRYGYIPDVINMQHKYIIEVDGSIHDLDRIKRKDAYREGVFKKKGYLVVRVKAFCDVSLRACIEIIQERRKETKGFLKNVQHGRKPIPKKQRSNVFRQHNRFAREQHKKLKLDIAQIRAISKLRNSSPDLAAMHKRVERAKKNK